MRYSTVRWSSKKASATPPEVKGGGVSNWVVFGTVAAGAAALYHTAVQDIRASRLWWAMSDLAAAALRRVDAEMAHGAAIRAAELGLGPQDLAGDDPVLGTEVWGMWFSNPVGLAAGWDKDARAVEASVEVGFGFTEVGTITPLPQEGNPKPRLFRLPEDQGLINRYGFNSGGAEQAEHRLRAALKARSSGSWARLGAVGVNVGKNKAATTADFAAGVTRFAPLADYLVVNVSSPNTPGLRDLQRREELSALISDVKQARADINWDDLKRTPPPLLIKVAPDITEQQARDIAAVAMDLQVDGIILTNTTIERPPYLRGVNKAETGGLSGAPLMRSSTAVLAQLCELTEGKIPLIGVGGVASGEDAYKKIRAGAWLVQVYSVLTFQGPSAVRQIKEELAEILKAEGFSSVDQAVGMDVLSAHPRRAGKGKQADRE